MAVEKVKCTNCKGTGYVQIGPNIRGLKKCPVCNGTGKKVIRTKEYCNKKE